jgi:hypothetical protein
VTSHFCKIARNFDPTHIINDITSALGGVAIGRDFTAYGTSERGITEDEGRFRLTFRYRDRVFRLIVTTTGEVVSEDSS